jgi:predicted Fe-S protein YdhL (DUF1289 family)
MIKSPCIKICKLSQSICIGCGRNIEEIKNWKEFSDEEKQKIIEKGAYILEIIKEK